MSAGASFDDADDVEVQVLDPEQDQESEESEEIDLEIPSAEESLRYFGVDFDVEGLVRRFERGELIVPRFDPVNPDAESSGYAPFQRNFVWSKKQMDRFIESILLGYPIPNIFLVELKSREYIVLDGQQRLTTLRNFYSGNYSTSRGDQEFALTYVPTASGFHDRTYDTLDPSDKRLLNNALIQATVVLPNGDDGKKAVYALFDRINSGGTKLNEQQIRVAIYNGSAVNMIRDMNQDENWRSLCGGPPHRDLKDQELLLRYLALKSVALRIVDNGEQSAYRAPMSTFMTNYIDDLDKTFTADTKAREVGEFARACSLLVESVGAQALRRNRTVNAARADSILVGLTLALRAKGALSTDQVRAAFEALDADAEFRDKSEKSTSHRTTVNRRLQLSVEAFRSV